MSHFVSVQNLIMLFEKIRCDLDMHEMRPDI